MGTDFLSSALQDFVASNIESIAELEALMLLCNSPQKTWSAAALAKRVYVSDAEALAMLRRLEQRGFLLAEDTASFRYLASGPRAPMVDQIVRAYRHSLIPLTNLIHSRANNVSQV